LDTLLTLDDRLPLTCSRSGACCHDKAIWLNPWELACLAQARTCSPRAFRDGFTTSGGLRLRMVEEDSRCSQYVGAGGCSVYARRPLACRLFPLGRRRERELTRYIHRGEAFPCLAVCPEVRDLPSLTVAEYLAGQQVTEGEAAQDAYLELTLDLAEGALALLLEGGLAASGDRLTLPRWRELGAMSDDDRAAALPAGWQDELTVPELEGPPGAPAEFVQRHRGRLQTRLGELLAAADTPEALRQACSLMMALSLHLGRSVGIDTNELAAHWIATARAHLG